ncbi:50S ribosomal protein L11 methyltransferase [Amorphus sp. 3PC139-8]|uniref:50S ribosomal protein L11 methyltransferase n=1 Tax=Amorphus sp. 3PC139-8 TaxID=2735676 RepID=UPI00345C7262
MAEAQPAAPVLKLFCVVPAERVDAAAMALESALEDESAVVSHYEIEDEGPWCVEALLIDAENAEAALASVKARLSDQDLAEGLQADWLGDEDWVAKSLAGLAPVKAGRFCVYGSHDRDRVAPSRWRLEIDAGQAFGTGHHETTVGCLLALEALGKAGELPVRAIDLGTGTGVLAAAMVRLGVRHVLASDIDPIAVDVARANLQAFGVAGQVRAVTAAGFEHPALRFAEPGLVVANVLARPLVALAPEMRRRILPEGIVILSGLRLTQERLVRGTYLAHGFRMVTSYPLGAWTTLVLQRRS